MTVKQRGDDAAADDAREAQVLLLQGDLGEKTALDAVALQLQAILIAFAASEAEALAAVCVLDGQLLPCKQKTVLGPTMRSHYIGHWTKSLTQVAAVRTCSKQGLAPSGFIFASLTAGCKVLLHGLISCSTPNETNPTGDMLRRLQMHARS